MHVLLVLAYLEESFPACVDHAYLLPWIQSREKISEKNSRNIQSSVHNENFSSNLYVEGKELSSFKKSKNMTFFRASFVKKRTLNLHHLNKNQLYAFKCNTTTRMLIRINYLFCYRCEVLCTQSPSATPLPNGSVILRWSYYTAINYLSWLTLLNL